MSPAKALRSGWMMKSEKKPSVILRVFQTVPRRVSLKAIRRAKTMIAMEVGPVFLSVLTEEDRSWTYQLLQA